MVPVSIRPSITFSDSGGRIEVEVNARQTAGKPVDKLVIMIPMPKQVNSVNLTPNIGNQSYDQVGRVIRWEVERMTADKAATLRLSYLFCLVLYIFYSYARMSVPWPTASLPAIKYSAIRAAILMCAGFRWIYIVDTQLTTDREPAYNYCRL